MQVWKIQIIVGRRFKISAAFIVDREFAHVVRHSSQITGISWQGAHVHHRVFDELRNVFVCHLLQVCDGEVIGSDPLVLALVLDIESELAYYSVTVDPVVAVLDEYGLLEGVEVDIGFGRIGWMGRTGRTGSGWTERRDGLVFYMR